MAEHEAGKGDVIDAPTTVKEIEAALKVEVNTGAEAEVTRARATELPSQPRVVLAAFRTRGVSSIQPRRTFRNRNGAPQD